MDEEYKKRFFEALQQHTGTASVKIYFRGGGDNGQVQEISVAGLLDEASLKKLPAPKEFASSGPAADTSWYDAIENFAYSLIGDVIDFDWINNDGGAGTIWIEPFSGRCWVDAEMFETCTRVHHSRIEASLEGAPEIEHVEPHVEIEDDGRW